MSNPMVSPSSPFDYPIEHVVPTAALSAFAAEREALDQVAAPAADAGPAAHYKADLGPRELDRALGQLLAARRQTEWLLCRYLADIAEGRRFREIGYYSDILHYARDRLGLSVKSTRERLRIGRALRALPRVEHAFVAGRLGYSRVRELTRVATADDEEQWLELGRRLPMRELERRVAAVVGAEAMTDAPAEIRWRTPETVELRMQLPAEVWALLSRAMQGAREAAEAPMSDAEAIEAVAREALARLCEPDGAAKGDPRKAVVLYRCRLCGQTEVETGAVPVPLAPAQANRLACGAKLVDLATEGYEEQCTGGTMPAAVRRAVLARDRARCRVCGRRRYVDVHHLVPRSQGGAHSRSGCATLCTTCHAALHEGKLRAEGDADEGLRWFDSEGSEIHARATHETPPTGSAQPPGARAPVAALRHQEATGEAMASEPTAGSSEPFVVDATTLLRAMGGRGGWTADALTEATGLGAGRVAAALIALQVERRAVPDGFGRFSPVAAPSGVGAGQRPSALTVFECGVHWHQDESCAVPAQPGASIVAHDVPRGASMVVHNVAIGAGDQASVSRLSSQSR
jgi:hypothetical protein